MPCLPMVRDEIYLYKMYWNVCNQDRGFIARDLVTENVIKGLCVTRERKQKKQNFFVDISTEIQSCECIWLIKTVRILCRYLYM